MSEKEYNMIKEIIPPKSKPNTKEEKTPIIAMLGSEFLMALIPLVRIESLTQRKTYDRQSTSMKSSTQSFTTVRNSLTWFGDPAYVHGREAPNILHM